jgi:hypothetical protein
MYNALKTDVATLLGISKDALHIHLGLFLFVALVLLLRRSPAHPLPWLIVLGFEVVNEVFDIFHWHSGAWSIQLGDSVQDLINTMWWPTVALLLARWDLRRQERTSRLNSTRETRPSA